MKRSHQTIIVFPACRWVMVAAMILAGLTSFNTAAEPANGVKSTSKKAKARPGTVTDTPYGLREDVLTFAHRTAALHDLDAQWVSHQLASAKRVAAVQKLMMPPPAGTAKNWGAYRDRFLIPDRLEAGAQFWQQNERWLQAAQERWGVPPEVIVGIIGVETFYGRILGTFRVLDALATLSFDFPTGRSDRSDFFREQLTELLLLAHRQNVDAASWKGSYAGAMGLPQFMPSNINRIAVDFDEDGRVDLYGSPADVIGSVAHFLADAGWVGQMPARFEVAVPVSTTDRAHLLGPDITPSFTSTQFAERGAVLEAAAQQHDGLLALVELQMGDAAPVYVAGTRNFWVLTRYNRSSYYAMAVLALGEAVSRWRQQPGPGDGANTAAAPPARSGPAARCKPRTGRCARA